MLGEAVGLVADVLQQPQGVAVAAQVQRLGQLGGENQFLAFGQREERLGRMPSGRAPRARR